LAEAEMELSTVDLLNAEITF